jgi:Holliday junction DNA helicase RuvB
MPLEDEPMAQDLNDAAPSSLAHIIGQRAVVNQLQVALDASFQDHKRLDDALLVGPPGLGKSQIASVLGHELAVTTHEALGQSIKCAADLNALLLGAGDGEVVFIDECHELPKVFQTALYLALDRRKILVRGGNSFQSIPLSNFTLLLGSTDEFCLLQPLRDRMKMVLRFEFYSVEELTTIVRHRAKALHWATDEQLPPMIAQRARGTPRLALRLLQACRRVCRAEGQETITMEHFRKACDLEALDDLGLGPMEQNYLKILAEGASRLNIIASMLGLPARTIATVTEPFLIRAGLVVKDDGGRRQITAAGREQVSKSCQISVQLPSE